VSILSEILKIIILDQVKWISQKKACNISCIKLWSYVFLLMFSSVFNEEPPSFLRQLVWNFATRLIAGCFFYIIRLNIRKPKMCKIWAVYDDFRLWLQISLERMDRHLSCCQYWGPCMNPRLECICTRHLNSKMSGRVVPMTLSGCCKR